MVFKCEIVLGVVVESPFWHDTPAQKVMNLMFRYQVVSPNVKICCHIVVDAGNSVTLRSRRSRRRFVAPKQRACVPQNNTVSVLYCRVSRDDDGLNSVFLHAEDSETTPQNKSSSIYQSFLPSAAAERRRSLSFATGSRSDSLLNK